MSNGEEDIWERSRYGAFVDLLCVPAFRHGLSGGALRSETSRRCDAIENSVATLGEFKAANPNLILSTHVIVGFPSETDDDFRATLDLPARINFDTIALLPHYDAEETLSFRMDDEVHDTTICDRVRSAVKTFGERKMVLHKDGMWNVTAPTAGLSNEEIMKIIFLNMAKA